MNLRRHLDVLWRFRLIVISGAVLGIVLATLVVFRPTTSGLEWRAGEVWSSQSTIFVTQDGFPWGRVILPGPQATAGAVLPAGTLPQDTESSGKKNEEFADPGRFANLGILYSYFAKSDRVRALMRPVPDPEQLLVTPVQAAQNTTEVLPLLAVETQAATPAEARKLNQSAIDALTRFLEQQQRDSKIAADDRVLLEVLNPPSKGTMLIGRSKTPALVALVLVMALALALSYCLDNLYPRRRPLVDSVELDNAEFDEFFAVPTAAGAPEVSRRAS
jgi:hypothetical protein